jgi:ribosome maturation factor RimP
MTPFEAKLTTLLEPSLDGMGYHLVRVMMRGDIRKTLQIMAERKDQKAMTVDDCEAISETISAVLDVHDPIKERYALEVSSPGIDRPLIKPSDFARYVGYEAKIDLKEIYLNRRSLQGILRAANDNEVQIELERGEIFTTPFDMIHRAKLVLTDQLIDAHLQAQNQANQ